MLVCAGDMPFVPVALLASLADRADVPTGARVATGVAWRTGGCPRRGRRSSPRRAAGALQPLLGCYGPACLERLAAAAREAVAPARAVVEALGPLVVPVTDPRALFNVNSAEDLREAEALLAAG